MANPMSVSCSKGNHINNLKASSVRGQSELQIYTKTDLV